MYTQCPDCKTAFRVTAQVLQKAAGRVRCGGCGNAFSAIDHLSEQLPVPAESRAANDREAVADTAREPIAEEGGSRASTDFVSKSEALLKTLSELAGDDNVRIEDTGIEWRVVEDVDEEEILIDDTGVVESLDDMRIDTDQTDDGGEQRSLKLRQAPRDERRYDDNSPLPDDFDDEDDEPYVPPAPKRRSEDHDIDADFDTHQIDMAMGEEADDWADLLDDEDRAVSPLPPPASTNGTELPFEVEEELAAIHSELLENAAALRAQPADHEPEATQEAELSAQTQILEGSAAHDELEIIAEREESISFDEPADIGTLEALDGADAVEELIDIAQPAEVETLAYAAELEQPEDLAELELLEESAEFEQLEDSAEFEQLEESAELEQLEKADESEKLRESTNIEDLERPEDIEEEEPVDLLDNQFDDYEEDELTPDQEADIVGKLRESTGAFQKQIEAAQQALDQGDIEFYGDQGDEPDEDIEDRTEIEPHDAAQGDDRVAGDELEVASDIEAMADEEIGEGSVPESELPIDEGANDTDDELAGSPDDEQEEPVAARDDEQLSHEDRLAHTMRMAGIDPADLEGDNVETIVMEGAHVRDALESEQGVPEQEAIAKLEDHGFLADTYAMNKGRMAGGRRSSDPAGIGMILGVVGLALLLAAQWVHNSRESLATHGFFKQTLGPVYRAVGQPVTPEWDIKGWRFLNTRGSADEDSQLLTIVSTVTNASEQPLPYPLVHVSLTDRYEEIIGSKVLEPGEYLAGDLDPSRPVVPGDRFGAVIAIASPSAEAVGFKLNVCYRVAAGRVRCATEDFKD